MLRINLDSLVAMAVEGKAKAPIARNWIVNLDGTYGYSYREGAMSIGVIVHADSPVAGHGPGVQVVLTTSRKGLLQPVCAAGANIGRYLRMGRWRK
jgi:hypothetical protein